MAESDAGICAYHYYHQTVPINGRNVTVEYYRPLKSGQFPLVFMLHGSSGAFTVQSDNEPAQDNFGEKALARNCFVVVLPHYMEAVGRKSLTDRSTAIALFPTMLHAVRALLSTAEALPWVKGQPVFLFGESLGGYLAVALAFESSEVVAVSEFSGGLPTEEVAAHPGKPHILISHGESDRLVPVLEAYSLERYCVRHHIPVEMQIYPGEGHYLSESTRRDILAHTVSLFQGETVHGWPKRAAVQPAMHPM